jgi:hypothetical protein
MMYRDSARPALLLSVALAAACSATPALAVEPPQTTEDGLQLQKRTKTRLVYVKPGAALAPYRRVHILDCYVEFEPDWQKDYNRSAAGMQRRVSDQDVERMKKGLADECRKVFAKELQEKGGYEVADVAAPDVLVLRPALINVEVAAPDLLSPGVGATIVRSAGQMTLYLELWDSASSTLLARVVDAKADSDAFAKRADRTTNVQAADRILRGWAGELREHLDAATGKPE